MGSIGTDGLEKLQTESIGFFVSKHVIILEIRVLRL